MTRLTIETTTRQIITSPSNALPVESATAKLGIGNAFEIQFVENGEGIEHPDGTIFRFGVKERGKLSGNYIVFSSTFEKTGSGMGTIYTVRPDWSTAEFGAAFLAAKDPDTLVFKLEIKWQKPGCEPDATQLIDLLAENELNRGTEGAPPSANPDFATTTDLAGKANTNHTHPAADISDSTSAGRALLTAADAGVQRTLLGVGASHSVPNRFTADHTGWHVGDLVRQTGDSVPESVTITVNGDLAEDGLYYYIAGDFYDVNPENYGWFLDGWTGPLSAEDVAANIAADINAQVDFVTATASGAVVTIVANNAGELNAAWSFYDPGYDQALDFTVAAVQSGAFGLPAGDFIVVDTDHLGDAAGYQSIGNTADFLNGYGAPTSAIGEEGNGYVDLYNGDFYHRDASGWTFVLNITGPQGATGNTGAAGAAGLTVPQLRRVAMQQWGTVGLTRTDYTLGGLPRGWRFDGAYVWVAESIVSGSILKIDPSDGSTVGTFSAGGDHPGVVCFDGTYIWVIIDGSGNGVDNLTKWLASDGSLAGTYSTGGTGFSFGGMAFDGTNFWVNDYTNGTVVKMSGSGSVIGTYTTAANASSILFDGTNIWVLSNATLKKINISSGAVLATYTVPISWAMIYDGTDIWLGRWVSTGNSLYRFHPATGTVDPTSYSRGANVTSLAFDGSHIWVLSSSGSIVTKHRISDGANLGTRALPGTSYECLFDGQNIWVGGYSASKISKLTI